MPKIEKQSTDKYKLLENYKNMLGARFDKDEILIMNKTTKQLRRPNSRAGQPCLSLDKCEIVGQNHAST